MRTFALILALAATNATASYRIENVPLPERLRGGLSEVAFSPGGALVVATRYGEIWIREQDGGSWRRFARGLDEPLGIVVESATVVYVAHRPELLRMEDTDGDGSADDFRVLGDDWGLSHNYHEFFYGLSRDAEGNFYGALGLDSSGDKGKSIRTRGRRNVEPVFEDPYHGSHVPYRGWVMKITPDGPTIPFASGFRQPNGVGMSPGGELFVTDNQGDYKPSSGLLHVERGDFHGHAETLKWAADFQPDAVTPEKLLRRYKPPAVVFPHGAMGVSAGEPVWDRTGGLFGPFSGQVFIGDFSNLVMRVGLEKVGGEWQGFVFPFLGRATAPYATGEPLAQGSIRAGIAPDGSLYLAQTGGWGGGSDGLQRVVWDGHVPAEVLTMSLTPRGFLLTFTKPMRRDLLADSANFELGRFRYYYHGKYGSPRIDEAAVPLRQVVVSEDGLRAELIVEDLEAGYLYEVSMENLLSANGEPLVHTLGYYTANRLLNGDAPLGGIVRLPRANETSLGAKEAAAVALRGPELLAAGEKVYRLFCVACHQPDGRGLAGGAANFVDDKSRLAKSDRELLDVIANGREGTGMPAFGSTLKASEQRAVLAYLRSMFGDDKSYPGDGYQE